MLQRPDEAIRAPVPTGQLIQLKVGQVRVNPGNPRRLFDPGPLADLKENIRTHGVLVPLTVYKLPGQDAYEILDGQRRYQCCQDLEREGQAVLIPANIVEPPTKIAGLLYMFNIHNYRQQWELMPTALSLEIVIRDLGTTDTQRLANLTGLNQKSVERCKLLLTFPTKYQLMSLEPDPKRRVPSNFWIEAHPVLELIKEELPDLWGGLGFEGVLDLLVEKLGRRNIRSVIHFRRIVEAFEVADNARRQVLRTLEQYVLDPDLETRTAFDPYLAGNRRSQDAIRTCRVFSATVAGMRLESVTENREELILELLHVRDVVSDLAASLEGADPPERAEPEYFEEPEGLVDNDKPESDAE